MNKMTELKQEEAIQIDTKLKHVESGEGEGEDGGEGGGEAGGQLQELLEGRLTEEQWQAILHNDASYDTKFLYGVKTTRIFCRPSCKSKAPNQSNVRIFSNAKQAQSARFRPCKRCKPTGERLPDKEWVAQIRHYIDTHYNQALTLDALADECHGSPYHLQRTFKRVQGISPAEYVQQTRIAKASDYLIHSDQTVTEIGATVGLPNTPYFITLFKKLTGHTPAEYRQLNLRNPIKEGSEEFHNGSKNRSENGNGST